MPSTRTTAAVERFAARRRVALRHCKTTARAGAVLITHPADVRYLSDFTGEDSCLLMTADQATLITDGRFTEQAGLECDGIDIHVRTGPVSAACAGLLRRTRLRRLAVQADHMTLRMKAHLAGKLAGRRIVEVSDLTAASRGVKDAGEISTIRRAVRIAEQAMRQLMSDGQKAFVGFSEREIAAKLDYLMRLAGADGPSFETIVACGAHSSLAHYRPASTVIRHGQVVLIDWGARVNGYCSDLTRVLFTGRIPREIASIYDVVLRGQQAAIAAVRPGVSCRTVDAVARKVISDAGYGEAFSHGLGHGIGLEVHEGPGLSGRSMARLRGGMTITIEPGIYLPGVGGVRIEDDILVGATGRCRLSSLPRQLATMVLK